MEDEKLNLDMIKSDNNHIVITYDFLDSKKDNEILRIFFQEIGMYRFITELIGKGSNRYRFIQITGEAKKLDKLYIKLQKVIAQLNG